MNIELVGISKRFNKEGNAIDVLKDVDLTIPAGNSLAVIGVSGAGKSTLLNILGTIMRASSGKLLFDNCDVLSRSEKEIANFRNRKIGFVFQSFNLLSEFTCVENVMLPALIAGVAKAQALKQATELLDEFGLHNRQKHRPGELSGGEQQRVAVARALVMNPEIILADEPTGNLDRHTGDEIADFLSALNARKKVSLIIVTHNARLADKMSRKITIIDGKIASDE